MSKYPNSLSTIGVWLSYNDGERVLFIPNTLSNYEYYEKRNNRVGTLEDLKKIYPYHLYGSIYSKINNKKRPQKTFRY